MSKFFARAALLGGAAMMVAQAVPAAAAEKPGSVHVQCDGMPDNVSGVETAARLLAITAVVGLLLPEPEQADANKRLKGDAGIAACTAALTAETNTLRKVQLTLARAIHGIEAGKGEAAVADARAAREAAGSLMEERNFARSVGLWVLEVEAAALIKAGRFKEAESVALKMADTAPWDVINQRNAWWYLGMTRDHEQEFSAFLDRLARLWNGAVRERASNDEWHGRFRQAAEAYHATIDVTEHAGFLEETQDPRPYWNARSAVAYMLAGDKDKARALADQARVGNEALAARQVVANAAAIGWTDELLELHQILNLADQGKLGEARARFKVRPRWTAATTGALAASVERLRAGAKPADLEGPLAKTSAEIREDLLQQTRKARQDDAKLPDRLFARIRPVMKASEFSNARSVWKTDKSPYLLKKKGKLAAVPYDLIVTHNIYGIPGSYAVLMHAALLAQAKGKQGFVLVGNRTRTDMIGVLFGNPGEPGIPASMLIEAAPVIKAMRADFPEPVRAR